MASTLYLTRVWSKSCVLQKLLKCYSTNDKLSEFSGIREVVLPARMQTLRRRSERVSDRRHAARLRSGMEQLAEDQHNRNTKENEQRHARVRFAIHFGN
jgi:hypothetical protein